MCCLTVKEMHLVENNFPQSAPKGGQMGTRPNQMRFVEIGMVGAEVLDAQETAIHA